MNRSIIISSLVGVGMFLVNGVQTAIAEPPILVSPSGKYLGTLSNNPYESDSVSNPYGRYGSRYSSDSINNPYGQYGSPYSNESARNPYAANPPEVISPSGGYSGY